MPKEIGPMLLPARTGKTSGQPWHLRILHRTLRCLPRGHQTFMRTYARWFGQGDWFIARWEDLHWRVDTNDFHMAGGIFLHGVHEPTITLVFCSLLADARVVVDVGANKGYYSLLAALAGGPRRLVVAVEPWPENAAILRQNLQLNGVENVLVCEVAASGHEGTCHFMMPPRGNSGLAHVAGAANGAGMDPRLIRCRRLDDLLDELQIGEIDLLKMDVEGAETLAIEGLARLLAGRKVHHLLLEMHMDLLTQAEAGGVYDLLRYHGYRVRRIDERDEEALADLRKGTTDRSRFLEEFDTAAPWHSPSPPFLLWDRGTDPSGRSVATVEGQLAS
jgi:FkbM family methyltransferase